MLSSEPEAVNMACGGKLSNACLPKVNFKTRQVVQRREPRHEDFDLSGSPEYYRPATFLSRCWTQHEYKQSAGERRFQAVRSREGAFAYRRTVASWFTRIVLRLAAARDAISITVEFHGAATQRYKTRHFNLAQECFSPRARIHFATRRGDLIDMRYDH